MPSMSPNRRSLTDLEWREEVILRYYRRRNEPWNRLRREVWAAFEPLFVSTLGLLTRLEKRLHR